MSKRLLWQMTREAVAAGRGFAPGLLTPDVAILALFFRAAPVFSVFWSRSLATRD